MAVVVAVISRKGGVGKSTLARGLAALATRNGLSTVLADLDAQQRTASRWHALRARHQVFPPLAVRAHPNVDAAVATDGKTDLLIVDTPSSDPALIQEVASIAHLIVQPSGSCFDELQPAVELFDALNASGLPRTRLLLALSRVLEPAEAEAARAYLAISGFDLLPGAVVERARYREAHNRGLSFIESPGEDADGHGIHLLGAILHLAQRKLRTLQPDRSARLPVWRSTQPAAPAHSPA